MLIDIDTDEPIDRIPYRREFDVLRDRLPDPEFDLTSAGWRAHNRQLELRERCRSMLPEGAFALTAVAWADRGLV